MFKRVTEFLIGHKAILAGLVLVAVFGLIYYHSRNRELSLQANSEVLASYQKKLEKNPYDGNLLLRAARHHYYVIRNQLQENRPVSEVKPLIRRSLALYRRLNVRSQWELQQRDFFIGAYLYYKLGEDYYPRARELALKSYNQGGRSPELIALLANIHYSLGKHETALKYFETLGSNLRDPVLIFNKARCLWALGGEENLNRARKLLKNGYQLLESGGYDSPEISKNYRLARARVELDLQDYSRAKKIVQKKPNWREDPEFLTLYAEILLGQGQREQARDILEPVVAADATPRQAELLLEKLEENT